MHIPIMKTGALRAILPAALIAVLGVYSAVAQTGTIAGKVKDIRTGQYLENARVTVTASQKQALTDSFGQFRISGVPAGTAEITVFFTGYYSTTQTIEVSENIVANVNVDLRSRSSFESEEDVYELDAFVVKSQYDAQAAAIHEQRFAPSNKAVIDAEALGNINEGNIGEFVKFLPGISINYVAADVRNIEVRGMGANFTPVTVDGNKMASAASSSMSRGFELEQVSLNNVERVEVVKVPTADMPANSLGGSVNLVSKSAFERDGREIRYNVYLSANSESMNPFSKQPGPGPKERYHVLPGAKFTYADVYDDGKLGIIVNYLTSNQWNPQHRSYFTWHFDDIADGVNDIATLERYGTQDGPKLNYRQSFNVKMDYKLSENTILLTSGQWNYYESRFRNTNVQWDTNVQRQSQNQSSDPTVIRSALNNADISTGGSWRDKFGDTFHYDAKIQHTMGDLELNVGGYWSRATNKYRSYTRGFVEMANFNYNDVDGVIQFSDFGGKDKIDSTVVVEHIDGSGTNNPGLGVSDLAPFKLASIHPYRPRNSEDKIIGWDADAKWNYTMDSGVSGYVKAGLAYMKNKRYNNDDRHRYYATGPDGIRNSGDELSGANFVNDVYAFNDQHFFLPSVIAWPDFSKVKDHWDQYSATDYVLRTVDGRGTEQFQETITAAYIMGSMNLFNNRVQVNGGMRFEKTETSSLGRNQSAWVNGEYDTSHPSINVRWDISDKLVARFAYANTIGRQNFGDLITNITINYPDPSDDDPNGSVSTNNPELKPQSAENYDATLEYYTDNAGVISVGVFRKEITDYMRSVAIDVDQGIINQYNLPSDTLGFEFRTRENAGFAEVNGLELNFQQELTFLPEAFSGISVFANGTFLDIEGNFGGSGIETDLRGFVKETWNYGISFSRWNMTTNLKFTHKGEEFDGATSSNELGRNGDGGRYFDPFDHMDFDLEYRFNERYTVYMSARNMLNNSQDRVLKSKSLGVHILDRSEEFGVQYSIGVKGSF